MKNRKIKTKLIPGKAFHEVLIGSETFNYDVIDNTLQDVIKSYKEKLKEIDQINDFNSIETGFISQLVISSDRSRIFNAINKLGIKNIYNKNKYHFTLVFDKKNKNIEIEEMDRSIFFNAKAVDIKHLGEYSDTPALAIVFSSPEIEERAKYLKSLGFESKYDDFIPHITIKYHPTYKDVLKARDNLQDILDHIGIIKCGYERWHKII